MTKDGAVGLKDAQNVIQDQGLHVHVVFEVLRFWKRLPGALDELNNPDVLTIAWSSAIRKDWQNGWRRIRGNVANHYANFSARNDEKGKRA